MADWKNWTDQMRGGEKYHKTTLGTGTSGMPVIEVDPSNPYGSREGRGMALSFYHVPSGDAVYFKAFVTAYNETFNSDWASETVYGRTDPIYMFKNTRRQISLAFKVPAFSEGEAYENLGRVQKLTQYLYPAYADASAGGRIIAQSPLIRMKVMNLAAIGTYGGPADAFDNFEGGPAGYHKAMAQNLSGSALYSNYRSTSKANSGLLGVIASVQINHNLEEQGVLEKGHNTILPKLIDVAVTFDVIHEQTLGWDSQGESLAPGFPYNVILEEPYDPTNSAESYDDRVAATEAEREDRDRKQQQRDNAEARYAGMFGERGLFGGGGRLGRDQRRAAKGKLNEYEASALAGALGVDVDEQWTSGESAPTSGGGGTFDEGEGWG